MQSDESARTFQDELETRRNRSSKLMELAIQAGFVDAAVATEPEPAASAPEESFAAMPPAFDEESLAVSETAVPDLEIPDEAPAPIEIPADPVAEAPEPAPTSPNNYFGSIDIDQPPPPAASEPVEEAESEESIAEATAQAFDEPRLPEPVVEQPPPPPEQLISESEDFLAEEPQILEEVEKTLAAEILAERIGQVVDIQRFPKTKPMRVLAKVKSEAKKAEAAAQKPAPAPKPPTAKAAPPAEKQKTPEKPRPADKPKPAENPLPEADAADLGAPDKPKKKRVSLLDSYFRGL